LKWLEEVRGGGRLESYQSYWAAKADMQARLGAAAAAASYRMAIGLESDPATRAFLLERMNAFLSRAR
jgi:RNA polymerase sigma-70 factor (ECF subfamily)